MCNSSKVSDDWVVKGFHVHIGGTELNVFPDHQGGIGFRQVFASAKPKNVARAVSIARQKCLSDPAVRDAWIRVLETASTFMLDYPGILGQRANGRMLEFKFLVLAIKREA